MNQEASINSVARELGLTIINRSWEQQLKMLEDEINRLLAHDFDRLVAILYRVDVSEIRLKALLKENPDEDAAKIIAALLIERQEQKIRTREMFNKPTEDSDEFEKW